MLIMRLVIGWYFVYFGFLAFTTPHWQLISYIRPAHTFTNFYLLVTKSNLLPLVEIGVKSLFVAVGILLIVGMFVRIASLLGIALMLFFYFPNLIFPYVADGSLIVDYHIIIAAALLVLWSVGAGHFFALGSVFRRSTL